MSKENKDSYAYRYLQNLHTQLLSVREGKVSHAIPELARAHPDWFAITIVTVDGQVFEVGDYMQHFTIQSISKPFVYGMVLQDQGRGYVATKVGVEPTGDPFNSITLDHVSNRPYNPMVNAGAIATTALVEGNDPSQRLDHMLKMFSHYVGHPLHVDATVFMSERLAGHRNRAIAHLMLNFGMLPHNIDEILDLFFQQSAIVVNCHDLAVMAATLANRGINPITQACAVERQYVKDILSVMYTCGMYDYAGQWLYNVGIPAKSSISGGIIAIVPGKLGIGVFSPLLDGRGNSVRGIKVCEQLSRELGLHVFDQSTDITLAKLMQFF